VLSRAISVLDAFDDDASHLSLDALHRRLGIPKPTLLRIVRTLELERFLVRTDDRYTLGPRILTIAHHYLGQTSLPRIAEPMFRRLARRHGLSISLAVLDELEVVYLAVENPKLELGLQGDLGKRHPAHATAVGKVLLAALDDATLHPRLRARPLQALTPNTLVDVDELLIDLDLVRRRGFAVDDEERGIGIRCVAVPIRDAGGVVLASMSCAGPTPRCPHESVPGLVSALQETAVAISEQIGFRQASGGRVAVP
jgi:DNA-binding IclR family transcriptional regulator